jgi:hypothetical protein
VRRDDRRVIGGPGWRKRGGLEKASVVLFWTGLLLTLTFWVVAWSKIPILSRHAFFPLWLGFIALANGLCEVFFADSLLRRLGASFLWLFAISIPFWWFFELLNRAVRNWEYVFPDPITRLQFAVEASIDFSTVIPAVMSTIYLCACAFRHFGLSFSGESFRVDKAWLAASVLAGAFGLVALAALPDIAFPLVWISPLLIIEPISYSLGLPSLLRRSQNGTYTLVVAIILATFLDGILWELWNFYSSPKWVYTIPHVGFWKIFEMPVLGYFGYPFFGLIVYSYTVIALSVRGASAVLTPDIVEQAEASVSRVQ